MEEQSQAVERVDPLSLFPEQMRQGVHDLTHLGYMARKVDFCGHVFVLETIRPYVKFVLAQVMEPWRNTIKEPDVYAALHVALALASIDGNTNFCPPTQDSLRGFAEGRLQWLTGPQGYWQPTIDYLFGQYLELEVEVGKAIAELHSLSQRSRGTSQPSPDSWTVAGLSNEPTDGDTQPTEPSN